MEVVEKYWRKSKIEEMYWSGPRGIRSEICRLFEVRELPYARVIENGEKVLSETADFNQVLAALDLAYHGPAPLVQPDELVLNVVNCGYIDNPPIIFA